VTIVHDRKNMLAVTYNIQWGKGRDGRIDLNRIAKTIEKADIIALQEVERHWREQACPDQVQRLLELLPGFDHVYGPAMDLGQGLGKPRRQFGNLILSRYPIMSTRNMPLPARSVIGHVNDQQAFLEAVVDIGHKKIRIYNVHLNYLSPDQRLEQIEMLLDFVRKAPGRGGAITAPGKSVLGPEDEFANLGVSPLPEMPDDAILLGDFNMTPQSAEYAMIAGEWSAIYGRLTAEFNFSDALTVVGFPENQGVTFPANALEPAMRLDHCFVSRGLVKSVKKAWIDHEVDGSDHQPVWTLLDI